MKKVIWGYILLIFLVQGCAIPKITILKDPLTPEEHITLGLAYEEQGKLDYAAREYEAASKELPSAWFYLGNVSFQKGDLAEAERYYRKAIRKDPGNADTYNNLAWLYYSQRENLDEAESLSLKAIDLNPSGKEAYMDTLHKIRESKSTVPESAENIGSP